MTRDVALDFLACGIDPSGRLFIDRVIKADMHELGGCFGIDADKHRVATCLRIRRRRACGVAWLFAYPVLMARYFGGECDGAGGTRGKI